MSYRRCYCLCSLSNCSVDLLSPLVFTVTALEISLFQVPKEWLYTPSPQLNDSLTSLVRLRSLCFTKTAKRFQNFMPHPAFIVFSLQKFGDILKVNLFFKISSSVLINQNKLGRRVHIFV